VAGPARHCLCLKSQIVPNALVVPAELFLGVYKYARMGYPLFANKIARQICIWIAARAMLNTRLLSSQEKIHDQPGRDTDHDQWPKI